MYTCLDVHQTLGIRQVLGLCNCNIPLDPACKLYRFSRPFRIDVNTKLWYSERLINQLRNGRELMMKKRVLIACRFGFVEVLALRCLWVSSSVPSPSILWNVQLALQLRAPQNCSLSTCSLTSFCLGPMTCHACHMAGLKTCLEVLEATLATYCLWFIQKQLLLSLQIHRFGKFRGSSKSPCMQGDFEEPAQSRDIEVPLSLKLC